MKYVRMAPLSILCGVAVARLGLRFTNDAPSSQLLLPAVLLALLLLRSISSRMWFSLALLGWTCLVAIKHSEVIFSEREFVLWGVLAIVLGMAMGLWLHLKGSLTFFKRFREQLPAVRHDERYFLVARGANDGLWHWDPVTNVFEISARGKELLGYQNEPWQDTWETWSEKVHPEDIGGLEIALRIYIKNSIHVFEREIRVRHQGGDYHWVLMRASAARNEKGQAILLAGSLTDITEKKTTEEQLNRQAFHDPLTGLANRAFLMRKLVRVLRRNQGGSRYAVLFLDLDRFKIVNDCLGHSAGDQLLVAIAQRVQASIRPDDLFARLGGDEFVVLLDSIESAEQVGEIAGRIQQQFNQAFLIQGQEVFSSASIGIVLDSGNYSNAEDLLRDADTAMYRAKMDGKSRSVIFTQEMHQHVSQALKLETDLRHAIVENQLEIVYQPIVDLSTTKTDGFEALLRWNHPTEGRISPSTFIPIAEESGLITNLGEFVLRRACERLAVWQRLVRRPISMNINVSPIQFRNLGLEQLMKRILTETQVDPSHVQLEITESAMLEYGEDLKSRMLAIRELGVRLQIDDFGTGYSSLSYLHQFPFDGLKIDRNFVKTLSGNGENTAIVRTITALAEHLGLSVTAEGVETEEQLFQLKTIRCPRAQGYFFSQPLNETDAARLLLEENPQPFSALPHSNEANHAKGC